MASRPFASVQLEINADCKGRNSVNVNFIAEISREKRFRIRRRFQLSHTEITNVASTRSWFAYQPVVNNGHLMEQVALQWHPLYALSQAPNWLFSSHRTHLTKNTIENQFFDVSYPLCDNYRALWIRYFWKFEAKCSSTFFLNLLLFE